MVPSADTATESVHPPLIFTGAGTSRRSVQPSDKVTPAIGAPTGAFQGSTGALPDVVNGYKWELYNITEDFTQNNDLAAKMPEKLKEMQALFLTEAAKYHVLPLDNTAFSRLLTPRPSAVAGRTEFTYTGENSGIPVGNAPVGIVPVMERVVVLVTPTAFAKSSVK